jgi:phenylacetate-CoA ligase
MKLEELRRIQNRKLRAVIKYAYENVEFYHRIFDGLRLKPDDIRTVADLLKLPVTTRSDIQKNFPAKIASRGISVNQCRKHVSSGSTGIPVTVLSDARTEAYRAALFARPFFECGLRLRHKMVRITATPQPKPKWYEHLGFMSKTVLNPTEPVEVGLTLLERFKPDTIFGQSSYLWQLAKKISETHAQTNSMLVFTTADFITKKMRDLVRSVLGTKVFDFYGCVEVERVSWECPEHVGYHMDIDSQVIEFVDGNEHVAPNERGQILLTCLYNYAMPLIRYDVGDIGRPMADECSCGRGLPMMRNIEGRVNDLIKRPDGSIISPMSLLYIDEIPGIVQFRIIQKRRDQVTVELVLNRDKPQEAILRAKVFVKRIVREGMEVEIIPVSEIPQEKSGKIRVIKSLV